MGAWTTSTVQSEQPLNPMPLLRSPTNVASEERLRGATNDLFELLERVQCSRLDDQRCVLPAYFSQVCTLFTVVLGRIFDRNANEPNGTQSMNNQFKFIPTNHMGRLICDSHMEGENHHLKVLRRNFLLRYNWIHLSRLAQKRVCARCTNELLFA